MLNKIQTEFGSLEKIMMQVATDAVGYIDDKNDKIPINKYRPEISTSLPDEGVGTISAIDYFFKNFGNNLAQNIGPRFFGFVTGGITPASLAGDWLVSTFDQVVSSDQESAAAFIERSTIKMLKELFNLPEEYHGTFTTGGTMSNVVSLAIARQWYGEEKGIDIQLNGMEEINECMVFSGNAHSSISKALSILGIGRDKLQLIPTIPGTEAINVSLLRNRLSKRNNLPSIVVANAGTVTLGDFDDLKKIQELKSEFNFWLHVDAAFGGMVSCTENYHHLIDGWQAADSITIDCHKWLNVPYDSAIQLTKQPHLQLKTFANSSDYLESPSFDNFIHLTPENSRRFRALPSWMTLMAYGKEEISKYVQQNIEWVKALAMDLKKLNGIEVYPPISNVICFKVGDGSLKQRDTFLSLLTEDGKAFFSASSFENEAVIRGAICNWSTSENDISIVLKSIEQALSKL